MSNTVQKIVVALGETIAALENYETNQPVMLVCEMPDYQKPDTCELRIFLHQCGDDNIYEKLSQSKVN